MFSDDALLQLNSNRYDIIYIDGNHTYEQVKKDIINYYPLIKNNGFISGHDYFIDNVKNAVYETIGLPDKIFIDYSWIKQIK
jgi:hypothetical protein